MEKSDDTETSEVGKQRDESSACPAVESTVEIYSPERIAEFLLNNAIGEQEYEEARAEVKGMGLDPDVIML